MPYIPYIPNIPYFPNMPYQTDHTHHTYPPYHTTPPPHHRGGRGTVPHPHHTTGGGGGRSHMGPVYGTHPPHHRGGRGTVPHPHHTTGGGGGRSHMGPVYGTHPPHHRGGRGTVPHPHHTTGGEGEDLIWDQYMGPIPYGGGEGGGWQGLVHIYIYIYLFIYLFIYIYLHCLGCFRYLFRFLLVCLCRSSNFLFFVRPSVPGLRSRHCAVAQSRSHHSHGTHDWLNCHECKHNLSGVHGESKRLLGCCHQFSLFGNVRWMRLMQHPKSDNLASLSQTIDGLIRLWEVWAWLQNM